MTIPALVKSFQEAQFHSAAKKVYSEINQAVLMAKSDNGGTFNNLPMCSGYDGWERLFCPDQPFVKYLKAAKYCKNPSDQGCWHKGGEWYYLATAFGKNTASILDSSSHEEVIHAGIITQPGVLMFGIYMGEDCTWHGEYCGHITFDVNGFKGPNTVGKDIYAVFITPDGIKPVNQKSVNINCDRNSGSGYACIEKVLKNEDY